MAEREDRAAAVVAGIKTMKSGHERMAVDELAKAYLADYGDESFSEIEAKWNEDPSKSRQWDIFVNKLRR